MPRARGEVAEAEREAPVRLASLTGLGSIVLTVMPSTQLGLSTIVASSSAWSASTVKRAW